MSECPMPGIRQGDSQGACPHQSSTSSSTPSPLISQSKPLKYNPEANDFHFDQEKANFQTKSLSTNRSTSSIPKSDFTPEHQPTGSINWVYPSGYNPSEDDVPVILAIHNMVNEKGWKQIKEWESLAGFPDPKLKRFIGRPNDRSPKSRFLELIGYSAPFDRHDWIVERDGQKEIRYVIDFYQGSMMSSNSAEAYFHVLGCSSCIGFHRSSF